MFYLVAGEEEGKEKHFACLKLSRDETELTINRFSMRGLQKPSYLASYCLTASIYSLKSVFKV